MLEKDLKSMVLPKEKLDNDCDLFRYKFCHSYYLLMSDAQCQKDWNVVSYLSK